MTVGPDGLVLAGTQAGYFGPKDSLTVCNLQFLHGIICKPVVGVDEDRADRLLEESTEWVPGRADPPEMEHGSARQGAARVVPSSQ